MAADQRQGIASAVADPAPVDAEAAWLRAVGEPSRETDVFGDRHPFDETEVLVDERHLAATAAPDLMPVGLAIDQHLTAIGPEQAAEDLDERGFAGAVLAEERQDLAAMHVETHAFQGARCAEAFGNVLEPEKPLGRHRSSPCGRPMAFRDRWPRIFARNQEGHR